MLGVCITWLLIPIILYRVTNWGDLRTLCTWQDYGYPWYVIWWHSEVTCESCVHVRILRTNDSVYVDTVRWHDNPVYMTGFRVTMILYMFTQWVDIIMPYTKQDYGYPWYCICFSHEVTWESCINDRTPGTHYTIYENSLYLTGFWVPTILYMVTQWGDMSFLCKW